MAARFEILPGLLGVGLLPVQFAQEGRPTHSEGLVVSVTPKVGDPWVGNFQRGLSRYDVALEHPNGIDVFVVAGGQGYVVDPQTRTLKLLFGAAIIDSRILPERRLVIFDHQGTEYSAYGVDGLVWRTVRLSYDGFRDVVIEGDRIVGLAWRPDDTWHRFSVDLETGRPEGGAYSWWED